MPVFTAELFTTAKLYRTEVPITDKKKCGAYIHTTDDFLAVKENHVICKKMKEAGIHHIK